MKEKIIALYFNSFLLLLYDNITMLIALKIALEVKNQEYFILELKNNLLMLINMEVSEKLKIF